MRKMIGVSLALLAFASLLWASEEKAWLKPALHFADVGADGAIYWGVTGGGLWKTTDEGETWENVLLAIPNESSRNCFSYSADVDGNGLFIRTGQTSYYCSSDGGETWRDVSSALREIAENDLLLPILYVSNGGRDLFCSSSKWDIYSHDYGETWQGSTTDMTICQKHMLYKRVSSSDTLYSCGLYQYVESIGGSYHGVVRSVDNGITWNYYDALFDFHELGHQHIDIYCFLQMSNGGFIMGTLPNDRSLPFWRRDRLVIADENCENLEGVSAEFPREYDPTSLAEDPHVPGRIYCGAAGNFAPLMVSNDYGRTWAPLESDSPLGFCHQIRSIETTESGCIVVGTGGDGLFLSDDSGETWRQVDPPETGGASRLTLFHSTLYQCNATNTSIDWLDLDTGEWTSLQHDVYPDTCELPRCVYWAEDDTMYYTTFKFRPDPEEYEPIEQLVKGDRTTQEWIYSEPCEAMGYLQAKRIPDGRVVTANVRCYPVPKISYDFGYHWVTYSGLPADGGSAMRVLIDDQATFFVKDTKIYRCPYDGTEAEEVYSGPYFDYAALHDTLYIQNRELRARMDVFTDGENVGTRTLPSGDPDLCWQFLTFGDEDYMLAWLFEDSFMWISRDYGITWQEFDFDLSYDNCVFGNFGFFADEDGGRVVLKTSYGYYWFPVTELAAGEGQVALRPATSSLKECYPNPFNNMATVRFEVAKNSPVKLELYDLTGRLVQTVADGDYAAGVHQVSVDGSILASGTYFIRATINDKVFTRKLTLIK